MKGYSKLETHEPPADDVKKGVAAPSSMTEIPLNDVIAHGEQPIAFPVGTVSVGAFLPTPSLFHLHWATPSPFRCPLPE